MRPRYYIDPKQLEAAYLDYMIETSEASLIALTDLFGIISRNTFNPRKTPFLRDMREDAIAEAQTEQWRSIYGFEPSRIPVRDEGSSGTALVAFFRGVATRSFIDQNRARQRFVLGAESKRDAIAEQITLAQRLRTWTNDAHAIDLLRLARKLDLFAPEGFKAHGLL